ncbi:unnamed protein product [Ambrosiozyma monospora]|uniref:Unnamed protein product n=1 Tax=Ambrosiozyma monospora TaxID=43982 RepID=A0ACB5SZT5_AMBMO|nr:unnamed protein product [Ambrosiozyma monospora]
METSMCLPHVQTTVTNSSNNNSNSNNNNSNNNKLSIGSASADTTNTGSNSLVRLATSNYNANHIAAIEEDSNRILILDLRLPGTPIKTLQSHSGTVNSISWHPTKNLLLSGGDDCQVLIHDLSDLESSPSTPKSNNGLESLSSSSTSVNAYNGDLAKFGYYEEYEVNNTCWSPDGDWVAVNSGRKLQAVKLD